MKRRLKHLYESAKVLYEIGAITVERLREYEEDCVFPETGGVAHDASTPVPAYVANGASPGCSHAG